MRQYCTSDISKSNNSEKEFNFNIDEAVEYVNRGRVMYNSESNGFGHTDGTAINYNNRMTSIHGMTSMHSSTQTMLSEFWVTAGMLKEFVSLKQLNAKIVDGQYYFALDDLEKVADYYRTAEFRSAIVRSFDADALKKSGNVASYNELIWELDSEEFYDVINKARKQVKKNRVIDFILLIIVIIAGLFVLFYA